MSEAVLLRFLRNSLIDVGGDDTKLERLQSTAADLAEILKSAPEKAAPFSLIAFDPNAPASDPVVTEALEALAKRWTTYANTFASTPVLVVRAMLLDALAQASRSDDRIAVAFATSARNVLPFMEVGDEKAIWADVIVQVESQVDAHAEKEWATPESITVPSFAFEAPPAPTIIPVKIRREAFVEQFEAAAGPQSGRGATSGNPHWPTSNVPWVTEFGSRMTEVVAKMVEAAAEKISVSGIDVSEPLNKLVTAVTSYVEGTLVAFSGATAGLQRRTGLLWWKEALYSPSARVSYRDVAPEAAVALMALDLHNQIPTFSPASVAAFLQETVLLLPSAGAPTKRSIGDLTTMARQLPALEPIRLAAARLFKAPRGRGPLLALIGHPHSLPELSDKEFRNLVGVAADTLLSLPLWATWLFHELQAARAAEEGVEAKRKRRKA